MGCHGGRAALSPLSVKVPGVSRGPREEAGARSVATWLPLGIMDVRFPPKLRRGDTVRVVAPARSRALVLEHDHSAVIDARLADMGLTLSYGRHVDERNDFYSSAVASRVQDLHEAFADQAVAAIMTVIGSFPATLASRRARDSRSLLQ